MEDNLYCPRCGKQFTNETVFCRTCGLSLDGVSQIVSGEAENKPVVTRRPNFKLFQIGIALFILGLVIGLINGALRDFELYPNSYGKMLFLVIIAAGMLLLGAGFVFPTKKYKKRNGSETALSDNGAKLETAPLAGQLEAGRVSANDIDFPKADREKITVGSVTEHTTRNLG